MRTPPPGVYDGPHEITTVEDTGSEVTRECSCGWVTIGTVPEPDHHTPLAEREQTHLDKAAKVADGTVWDEVPDGHSYQLHLRRRLRGQTPNQVVITAVWMGGAREVLWFPWTVQGLRDAGTWLDANGGATWAHSGSPVVTADLGVHAP